MWKKVEKSFETLKMMAMSINIIKSRIPPELFIATIYKK